MTQSRIFQLIACMACMSAMLLHTSWVFAEKKPERTKQELSDLHQRLESLKKELNSSKELTRMPPTH